jgi:hypothetical protein
MQKKTHLVKIDHQFLSKRKAVTLQINTHSSTSDINQPDNDIIIFSYFSNTSLVANCKKKHKYYITK